MRSPIPTLTHDQHKAAEAAFQGLPPDPAWTASAAQIYWGLRAAMEASQGQPSAELVASTRDDSNGSILRWRT
jgi:hypothetical protein